MSLINEALKRARTEAARQAEAEREGASPAATWTPPPFRRRERSPIVASIVASLLVSLVVGAAFYLLRGRNAPLSENVAAVAPAPASTARIAAPAAVDPPVTAPAPAAEAAPTQPLRVPQRTPPPARDARPREKAADPAAPRPRSLSDTDVGAAQGRRSNEPEDAPRTDAESVAATGVVMPAHAVPEAAPAAAAAPAARPRHGQLDGRTFTAAVALPDGSRIDLGGIISGTTPLAMLNGRMIGLGEYAGAYTVAKIEARRVELRGPEGSFWLGLP